MTQEEVLGCAIKEKLIKSHQRYEKLCLGNFFDEGLCKKEWMRKYGNVKVLTSLYFCELSGNGNFMEQKGRLRMRLLKHIK